MRTGYCRPTPTTSTTPATSSNGILTIDRADIPAVTQRRNLAHEVRGREPAPAPRCEIPEWFGALAPGRRRTWAAAEASHVRPRGRSATADRSCRRRRAGLGEVTAAPQPIETPSMTPCDASTGRAAILSRRGIDSPRRPAASGITPAATSPSPTSRVEHAEDYLERARQRTAAAIAGYTHAVAARDQLHTRSAPPQHHRNAEFQPGPWHQRRVDALQTWRRSANGNPSPSNDSAK